MFNDKANDNDRQKRLEDLIRKDYMEDEEEQETEIPNDDQINEIISRSAEEYEVFTKMDQERYVLEGKEARLQEIYEYWQNDHNKKSLPFPNLQNVNYRLIQEYEVPEWIKKNSKAEEPKEIEELGAGKRQRKTVNYNEEFSEGQWLKIIEQGGDPQAEADKIRKRREMGELGEGMTGKRRKLNDATGFVEEEDDYDVEDGDEDEEDYEYSSKPKQAKAGSTKISLPNFGKYHQDDEIDGLVQSDDQQE
jgi:hypothetical protein